MLSKNSLLHCSFLLFFLRYQSIGICFLKIVCKLPPLYYSQWSKYSNTNSPPISTTFTSSQKHYDKSAPLTKSLQRKLGRAGMVQKIIVFSHEKEMWNSKQFVPKPLFIILTIAWLHPPRPTWLLTRNKYICRMKMTIIIDSQDPESSTIQASKFKPNPNFASWQKTHEDTNSSVQWHNLATIKFENIPYSKISAAKTTTT